MKKEKSNSFAIKYAVDLVTLRNISSDELLKADDRRYNRIRREATESRLFDEPRFVCGQCHHPVYAPRSSRKRAYWKHFVGAPHTCTWHTSTPSNIDKVSASQFQGRQEGALHRKIKHVLADLLREDSKASDVHVEKYLVSDEGKRRPDVSAEYDGQKIAFEIQLATTQLPIILAKEKFYRENDRRIVWITWDFQHVPMSSVRQSFQDIYFGHNENIFSMDSEVIEKSSQSGRVHLKANAYREGGWVSRLVAFDDLKWGETGLPYVFPAEPTWADEFKRRWIECQDLLYDLEAKSELLEELSSKLEVASTAHDWMDEKFHVFLDVLYSLEAGRPLFSREHNLVALSNSFLNSKGIGRYALAFEFAAEKFGRKEVLSRSSVSKKLSIGKQAKQLERGSEASRAIRELFPKLVSDRSK